MTLGHGAELRQGQRRHLAFAQLEVVQIVGPVGHHQDALLDELGPVVGRIRILDLKEMISVIGPSLSTTLAGTEVGRMLQLFKAAGLKVGD